MTTMMMLLLAGVLGIMVGLGKDLRKAYSFLWLLAAAVMAVAALGRTFGIWGVQ